MSIVTTDYVSKVNPTEGECIKESYWLEEVIRKKYSDELLIRSRLGAIDFKTLNNLNYQICILYMNKNDSENCMDASLPNRYIGIVKAIFEQHSFRVYPVVQNHRLVILAFDLFASRTRKEQLAKKDVFQCIANQINGILNYEENNKYTVYMSVSTSQKGLNAVYFCYEEAVKALLLKSIFKSPAIFYDDLGAFQLLLNLQEKGLLKSYVLRHLGPILEEDQKKNSDLLKTLKIYLERDGSKQSVADELHIVRQSLYYRLDKIKELLGEEYMCTQNRLALQLAIQAYELLRFEEINNEEGRYVL